MLADFYLNIHKKMSARFLICLMLVAVLAGCSTGRRTSTGEPIYFVGTQQYQRKLETLTLSSEQARDRVASFVTATRLPSNTSKVLIGEHRVIVGDCFVFSLQGKVGITLSGYYVDGHTGVVTKRQGEQTSLPKKL